MLRIYGVDNKKHKCSRLTKIHYMHGTTYVIKIKVMHLIIILYGLIHVATSNSCRNQPSSYGYDLNDVDYMCDVINQFCDGSVCTQKLADSEILYPLNVDPTVACVSGHSEIDVNQGFQPRCSTTSGGGVCIGGPNPCMTNYCTDKYGFTYPAELIKSDTTVAAQAQSYEARKFATRVRDQAKVDYFTAWNYAVLSSIAYSKYIDYPENGNKGPQFAKAIQDCDGFNKHVDALIRNDNTYASTRMTPIQTWLNSNTNDTRWSKLEKLYYEPQHLASTTNEESLKAIVELGLDRCNSVDNYILAQHKKNVYVVANATWNAAQPPELVSPMFRCRTYCPQKIKDLKSLGTAMAFNVVDIFSRQIVSGCFFLVWEVCAETRNPTKYRLASAALGGCAPAYKIKTQEQCLMAALSLPELQDQLQHLTVDSMDTTDCADSWTDPLVTNHWTSNTNRPWNIIDPPNAYSNFGPCGTYGTCTALPNAVTDPPVGFDNIIRCQCRRGQGYFCEEDFCDGYCKNGGNCTLIGGEPACECPANYFGSDCALSSLENAATGKWVQWGAHYNYEFEEGQELISYESVESDMGDDGADAATVTQPTPQSYWCFGDLASCNDSSEGKSVRMLVSDLSQGAFFSLGEFLKILFSGDFGAARDIEIERNNRYWWRLHTYWKKKLDAVTQQILEFESYVYRMRVDINQTTDVDDKTQLVSNYTNELVDLLNRAANPNVENPPTVAYTTNDTISIIGTDLEELQRLVEDMTNITNAAKVNNIIDTTAIGQENVYASPQFLAVDDGTVLFSSITDDEPDGIKNYYRDYHGHCDYPGDRTLLHHIGSDALCQQHSEIKSDRVCCKQRYSVNKDSTCQGLLGLISKIITVADCTAAAGELFGLNLTTTTIESPEQISGCSRNRGTGKLQFNTATSSVSCGTNNNDCLCALHPYIQSNVWVNECEISDMRPNYSALKFNNISCSPDKYDSDTLRYTYSEISSETCDNNITTAIECEVAAMALGGLAQMASDPKTGDTLTGDTLTLPGCYTVAGELRFNNKEPPTDKCGATGYTFQTSGTCQYPITTATECDTAAEKLGVTPDLTDYRLYATRLSGCSIKDGVLMFNEVTNNKECGEDERKCLCKVQSKCLCKTQVETTIDTLIAKRYEILRDIKSRTTRIENYIATQLEIANAIPISADVVDKVIGDERGEGEEARSIDFSMTALTPRPNVALLSISDFFGMVVESVLGLVEVPATIISAMKIFVNVVMIPVLGSGLVSDIRSLKLTVRLNEKLQFVKLTARPHITFSKAACVNNPESITCLLGEVATFAFGDDAVAQVEQMLQSLEFKFKVQHKMRGSENTVKFTVSMLQPLVIVDTEDIYLALESTSGGGPSLFFDWAQTKAKPATAKKIGGTIPFRLKMGKTTDITVIGGFDYAMGSTPRKYTLQARLPFWIMDVVPIFQIPVHVNDISLKITFGEAGGRRSIQFGGGVCLGTEANCRSKTCDFIQGYYFKNINVAKPEEHMDALLLTEVSLTKVMRVMCSSEWFGFCNSVDEKTTFMSAVTHMENNFGWLVGFGWLPLTPPCTDPTDVIGNGCCTREEMIDVGLSFAKQCYSKIIISPKQDFAFPTQTSTIPIEKGYTLSGRLVIFGYGANIFLKANSYKQGPVTRHQLDGAITLDVLDIGGLGVFRVVNSADNQLEGPAIEIKVRSPLSITFTMNGYLSIPPLGIGVGFNGTMSSTTEMTYHASFKLFDAFEANIRAQFWLNPIAQAIHKGSNKVKISIDASGLNDFVTGAITNLKQLITGVGTTIKSKINEFTVTLNGLAVTVCDTIFPPIDVSPITATLGDIGEMTGIEAITNMLVLIQVPADIIEAVLNLLNTGCKSILQILVDIVAEAVKFVTDQLVSGINCMLTQAEALLAASGSLFTLEYFEMEHSVGYNGAGASLQVKGSLFGNPFDLILDTSEILNELSENAIGAVVNLIKDHFVGRRLNSIDNTHDRRRLSNRNPLELVQDMFDTVIEDLSEMIPTMIEHFINGFVALGELDFTKAFEQLGKAIAAPATLLQKFTCLDVTTQDRRRLSNPSEEAAKEKMCNDPSRHLIDTECNLGIEAFYLLTGNCMYKQCMWGCNIDSTCNSCNPDTSTNTCTDPNKFCDLGKCIAKKPYGALTGVLLAENVCQSGISDENYPFPKCIDCNSDSECHDALKTKCNEQNMGYVDDNYRENLGENKRDSWGRVHCIDNQCKHENRRAKPTESRTWRLAGQCGDKYGHTWEFSCPKGAVRRGERFKYTCASDCCTTHDAVGVARDKCDATIAVPYGEHSARQHWKNRLEDYLSEQPKPSRFKDLGGFSTHFLNFQFYDTEKTSLGNVDDLNECAYACLLEASCIYFTHDGTTCLWHHVNYMMPGLNIRPENGVDIHKLNLAQMKTSCIWGCCNPDGTDAGYSSRPYCPGEDDGYTDDWKTYTRDDLDNYGTWKLPRRDTCGYDCCAQGGTDHGAGFFILPTDAAYDENDNYMCHPYWPVSKKNDDHYKVVTSRQKYYQYKYGWSDRRGKACHYLSDDNSYMRYKFHLSSAYQRFQVMAWKEDPEFVTNLFKQLTSYRVSVGDDGPNHDEPGGCLIQSWDCENGWGSSGCICAHTCCNSAGHSGGYAEFDCEPQPGKEMTTYVATTYTYCGKNCCYKWGGGWVGVAKVWDLYPSNGIQDYRSRCTVNQAVFKDGVLSHSDYNEARKNGHYTRGWRGYGGVKFPCTWDCCYNRGQPAPQWKYCNVMTYAGSHDTLKNTYDIDPSIPANSDAFISDSSKSSYGVETRPYCAFGCCTSGGAPTATVCKDFHNGNTVVSRGDVTNALGKCVWGCCDKNDGTMVNYNRDHRACLDDQTSASNVFTQSMDCHFSGGYQQPHYTNSKYTEISGGWVNTQHNDDFEPGFPVRTPSETEGFQNENEQGRPTFYSYASNFCLYAEVIPVFNPKIQLTSTMCQDNSALDQKLKNLLSLGNTVKAFSQSASGKAITHGDSLVTIVGNALKMCTAMQRSEDMCSAMEGIDLYAPVANIQSELTKVMSLVGFITELSAEFTLTRTATEAQKLQTLLDANNYDLQFNAVETNVQTLLEALPYLHAAVTENGVAITALLDGWRVNAPLVALEDLITSLGQGVVAEDLNQWQTQRIVQEGQRKDTWWKEVIEVMNIDTVFDGTSRTLNSRIQYMHISDLSCSYYGAATVSSPHECRRAAESLGITYSDFKETTSSSEPGGCYLWSSSSELRYNGEVSSTAKCSSGGCFCVKDYVQLQSDGTCDSAGLEPITSATECKMAALQFDLPASSLRLTLESAPYCSLGWDGSVKYNEGPRKNNPFVVQGYCSHTIDTSDKCFAVAERMGLAGRRTRFAQRVDDDCDNIGDLTDDGYQCCSGSRGTCSDNSCWWPSANVGAAGVCDEHPEISGNVSVSSTDRPSGCFINENFVPHFNDQLTSVKCSSEYPCICDELLRHGTCVSTGSADIRTFDKCKRYAIERGWGVPTVAASDGPRGCSVDEDGKAYFRETGTSLCSARFGCICDTLLREGDCTHRIDDERMCYLSAIGNGYRSGHHTSDHWNDRPPGCSVNNNGDPQYNTNKDSQVDCSDAYGCVCDVSRTITCDDGCLCRNTFTTITTGTCLSNGHGPVRTADGCRSASIAQSVSVVQDVEEVSDSAYPVHCSMNNNGNVYYNSMSQGRDCVVDTFSLSIDWNGPSTFTDCGQFLNTIGPYAGTTNVDEWLVNECFAGFTTGDCSTATDGDGTTACNFGVEAKRKSTRGCLCEINSACIKTQVSDSDKSSVDSITGLLGDVVYYVCDDGYYIRDSDNMRGGSLRCTSDRFFAFTEGSDVCVPIPRANSTSSPQYRSLSPGNKVRVIAMSNAENATRGTRILSSELPRSLSEDITSVYQSQNIDIYTQDTELTKDQCERGVDCCEVGLDIDTMTPLDIPTTLFRSGLCRSPITTVEECAAAAMSIGNGSRFTSPDCAICGSPEATVFEVDQASHTSRLYPPGCSLRRSGSVITPYLNLDLSSNLACSDLHECLCSEDMNENDHVRIQTGSCNRPVESTMECLAAVRTLKLSLENPYSATQITEGNWPDDPPGCFVHTLTGEVSVYFNTHVTSTVDCSTTSRSNTVPFGCICKSMSDTTPVLTLPLREGSWSVTCNRNKVVGKKTLSALGQSVGLKVISSQEKQRCLKPMTDEHACSVGASQLGLDEQVHVVDNPSAPPGCYHTLYETISTGQCEATGRVTSIEECQSAVILMGHRFTVSVDPAAPYGCHLQSSSVSFNGNVSQTRDVGSGSYNTICRDKKAYFNTHVKELECSQQERCICYGDKSYLPSSYNTECWDDYLRKWDSELELKDNYYECNHHKMSALTNTIVPQVCPPTEVSNSGKSAIGSINGTMFSSIQVTCDNNYVGGGTSSCDYHIVKNRHVAHKKSYHISEGVCQAPILNQRDCYTMAKSLDLTQIPMKDLYSGTHSSVFVESGNSSCSNPITSAEECVRSIEALGLDMLHTTQEKVRTIYEHLEQTPAGCILWKDPYTTKYLGYFNPHSQSSIACNHASDTSCICKTVDEFEMDTHTLMCQNTNSVKILDIHDARKNKWYSPDFTHVDIIPASLEASKYPHGCFLHKVDNDNEKLIAYFNPHYSNVDCNTANNPTSTRWEAGCLCTELFMGPVSSGTCQSHGYAPIDELGKCQTASSTLVPKEASEQIKIVESGQCLSVVDTLEECQTYANLLHLQKQIVVGDWPDIPYGCVLDGDTPKFNQGCGICGNARKLDCSNTSKCLCRNVVQPIAESSECICRSINDTSVPKAQGCVGHAGDTFFNSYISSTTCSVSEPCLCAAVVENNVLYSSEGSCLTIGRGYAPVKTATKCLEAAIDVGIINVFGADNLDIREIERHDRAPNCFQGTGGKVYLNTAPSTLDCHSSNSHGCLCEKKYSHIQSGTCDSQGYAPITSEELCKEAAISLHHPWHTQFGQDTLRFATDDNGPSACSERPDGSVFLNKHSSSTRCSAARGCFCQTKKIATFSEPACKLIEDCSPTQVDMSNASETGSISGHDSVTVTCNDGHNGGGLVTCNQLTGLFSTVQCKYCTKGYGYASATNHTCVRCVDDVTNATYNAIENSNSICITQRCPLGMGIVYDPSLNTEIAQDCVKCPEDTFSDSNDGGQCQHVRPGYRVETSDVLDNLVQVVPMNVDPVTVLPVYYEKYLFQTLNIQNTLLCTLRSLMADTIKKIGRLQVIAIEPLECWVPPNTDLPMNQGQYFIQDDGSPDALYNVSVPTSLYTVGTVKYNEDRKTIAFTIPQYSGVFSAITNPRNNLEMGEFILQWNSRPIQKEGHLIAVVGSDGHYLLKSYVKHNNSGVITEEFLYRNITGHWTKTQRSVGGSIETKTVTSTAQQIQIKTELDGVTTTSCYSTWDMSVVYEFQIQNITTSISNSKIVNCYGGSFDIPEINIEDIRESNLITDSGQLRISETPITCQTDVDRSPTLTTLTVGQSTDIQCDPGYIPENDINTVLCLADGTLSSVRCVKQNCIPTRVLNSNVSNLDAIQGLTDESVYVECDPGYVGSAFSTCMTSGSFSTVVCSKRQCSSCNICFNNYLNNGGYFTALFEEDVAIQCALGHVPSPPVATCQSNGVFSPVVCQQQSCVLTVAHSNTENTTVIDKNTTMSVVCDDGYSGGGTVTCNADTTLTPVVHCVPNQCTTTSVENSNTSTCNICRGQHNFNAIAGSTGQSRYVQCDPGYIGSAHATCMSSGNFNSVLCSRAPCSTTLPEGIQGQGTQLTSHYGIDVQVNCDYGYEGGGTISCDHNGNFNGISTLCTRKQCHVSIPNSLYHTTASINYQDSQNVICAVGYNGGGTVTCGVNGQYNDITCVPGVCNPTQIQHSDKHEAGSIQGSFHEKVTVTCDPLYQPVSAKGRVDMNTMELSCLTSGLFQTGECRLMYNFNDDPGIVKNNSYILKIATELKRTIATEIFYVAPVHTMKEIMTQLSDDLYLSSQGISGITKRQAAKISKLEIDKMAIDDKIRLRLPTSTRKVYVVPSPPNQGSIDTCSNGNNDDNCCTYMFTDNDLERNDVVVHTTGTEFLSWSVLCTNDTLVTKQMREREGFKMECWNSTTNAWENPVQNMTPGMPYGPCNDYTIIVGSQTPIAGTLCELPSVPYSQYENISVTAFTGETILVECDEHHMGGGQLTCVDGTFNANNVACYPVYNGNIYYDCQTAQEIYQTGNCCGGSESNVNIFNDKAVRCSDLQRGYNEQGCGCGSETSAFPVSLNQVVDFGFSQVEACKGVGVKVVWQGSHNIQETESSSCNSSHINSAVSGYQNSGHDALYTNDELSAAPGETRYFKCSTHCGVEAARFEVSCPLNA